MTTYLSMHDVTKVEIKEVDRHDRKHTGVFFVRHIVIRDAKGGKFELSLYSDERRSLELTGEGA